MVASLSKQPQTLTSKPARRLVYRLSRGSRYFVKLRTTYRQHSCRLVPLRTVWLVETINEARNANH